MEKEILFKGMTRPAMLYGVPIVPLVLTSAIIILIAIWTNLAFILCIFPVFLILRLFALQDDYIFNLMFLNIKTFTPLYNKKYYGAKSYHSSEYRKISDKKIIPELSILGLDKNPSFEKMLPYETLYNNIVISEDYLFMTTWKVEGVPFEIENKLDLESNKKSLNTIFKAFANESVSFYFHSARHDIEASLKGRFDNSFSTEINNNYYKSFEKGSLRGNTLYLTLIYNPFVNKLDKSSFLKAGKENKRLEILSYIKSLNDYANRLESNLKAFRPNRLGVYSYKGKDYSSQLEFYNFLIAGRFQRVRALNAPIKNYLIGGIKNVQFNGDMQQLNFTDDTKKFARAIEIKDYTSETYVGILNTLMYLNVNYTMTQSFNPVSKAEAKKALKKQERQLESSQDDSISQLEQFDIALDELTSGDLCFGNYHFSIFVYGDTIKEVKKNTNLVITGLNDIGLGVTLADMALPATYFAQFPSNFSYRPRVCLLSSKNFSSLMALHNFPKGKESLNCWGDAITILKTPNKQPYYFNVHQNTTNNDFGEFLLGNFMGIGQSGGGKTVMINFIANQMLKYNDKDTFPSNIPDNKKKITMVYLDKDKGAIGNILATGGRYVSLENGVPTGFNPFMCENTKKNKRNLQNLITLLVTRNNERLSSSEERKISNAIDFIMDNFEKEERKFGITLLLENLTQDFNDENSVKSRLELWQQGSKFGWVFDNEQDLLDFPDSIPFFGIDGTEFLDDSEVSGAMTYYILWRVLDLVDGRRFGLFIDEAWKWLENPLVQQETKNKLKTIRKENGLFGMFSQSVEDFLELEISKTIVEQSSTAIYFTNQKANKDDYTKGLNCTQEEYEIIKDLDPMAYQCLVKRASESAIVNLDLSSIGSENLKILSTGLPYVENVEGIFSQEHKSLDDKVSELREMYSS